jgi:hypothetical protein
MQRMREIERDRFPIPPADLQRYLVPYAQHFRHHLREKGKQGGNSSLNGLGGLPEKRKALECSCLWSPGKPPSAPEPRTQ